MVGSANGRAILAREASDRRERSRHSHGGIGPGGSAPPAPQGSKPLTASASHRPHPLENGKKVLAPENAPLVGDELRRRDLFIVRRRGWRLLVEDDSIRAAIPLVSPIPLLSPLSPFRTWWPDGSTPDRHQDSSPFKRRLSSPSQVQPRAEHRFDNAISAISSTHLIHESVRSGSVGVLTHNLAPRVDAKDLGGCRPLDFKSEIFSVLAP